MYSEGTLCTLPGMPKLWTRTIATHRREVGDAILDTTAALVAEHGLRSVTMSQIAAQAGIGRATLYKYFPDVDSMLVAWHERHVAGHLARLQQLSQRAKDPRDAVDTVLAAYALLVYERARQSGATDLAALVHQGHHVSALEQQLRRFFGDLIAEAARAGRVRSDVATDELVNFCLHALGAAAHAPDEGAVQRLAELTLAGLETSQAPRS